MRDLCVVNLELSFLTLNQTFADRGFDLRSGGSTLEVKLKFLHALALLLLICCFNMNREGSERKKKRKLEAFWA